MPERSEQPQLVHDLLDSIERDGKRSQRDRASEFNVALGVVNSYLKYCVKKGYIKVKKIPARRYLYFVTPQGFAEKSRLSLQLVSKSLVSFRQARHDYCEAFARLRSQGVSRVALIGHSELAEIALLCAMENGIRLVAIVDGGSVSSFADIRLVASLQEVAGGVDAAVITSLASPQACYDEAVVLLGTDMVIAPAILGLRVGKAA